MESISRTVESQLTAQIVSAYVSRNKVGAGQLTKLIGDIHSALVRAPAAAAEPVRQPLIPAIAIKKSVTPEYIVCLEDGRKLKSMKRHLSGLGMTPDEYRAKWDLPRDYPMVASSYAERRSALAKRMGLGRKSGGVAPAKKAASGGRSRRRAK
jgi:predicted transcriptional regulator